VSKIITIAIQRHIHYLLTNVHKFLTVNMPILNTSLETYHEFDSVLKIHLFEQYFLHMSIDWKTGKFLLSLKKGKYAVPFETKPFQDMINPSDAVRTKQFGQSLIQMIEKIRQRTIILAYEKATQLLDLDTFHSLPGLSRDRELKSEMLFVRFPSHSNVYISIKANSTNKMHKPVSCRIIFQVTPHLIEWKISELDPEEVDSMLLIKHTTEQEHNINGNGSQEINEPTRKKQKLSGEERARSSSPHLSAFKHLKRILEKYKNSVGQHSIIEQLEAKDGMAFQII
jgi:hypothetical protein